MLFWSFPVLGYACIISVFLPPEYCSLSKK
ncbi:hypothetical protein NC651_021512 [Populus alba x Populus x berolinensis]|nr:hypothetical protein NC651_021512 [Populus alba x Populus x berolinensis]